jgi:large subunit ribosomal protein L15
VIVRDLKRAEGALSSKNRVGRGPGSGNGKTAGKGHKGQKARAGKGVPLGFEGGQMPIQRRMPKSGFRSRKALNRDEIRLFELNAIEGDKVTLEILQAAGLIGVSAKDVKIILNGEVNKALSVSGVRVTKGAREAIEKAGGKVA